MKKKTIGLILSLLACCPCFAQISIDECYQKAQANYPLIKQYDLIEKTKEYNLSNANRGYLPQVIFSAKATYQSDVTKLPFDLAQLGIEGVSLSSLDKDQYGATIDITQTIWDGGTIRTQKESLTTAAEVERREVEVNIYAINEIVNQIYFGILLAGAQIRQNQLSQDELQRSYDQVLSYVQNGVANQADLNAIRVDLLKAKQSEAQFAATKKAYIEMLSKLIGEELAGDTEFLIPEPVLPSTNTINRPELNFYDAQVRNLEAKNREITSGLMPKFSLFATGGYGRPGLNMLSNDFDFYYMTGIRLSWNIGSFYTKRNSRRVVQANMQSIEIQRETFLFNTGLDITQKENSIDSYLEQLKYDDEIIELRASVKRASEAKMANGTISGSDLTRDITAEQMARQDKILHETEMLLAIYNLRFATNN